MLECNISTATNLRKAVKKFAAELAKQPPELVVLYYAGHGFQQGAKVYLVPADASGEDVDDVVREFLSLDDIWKTLLDVLDVPCKDLDKDIAFLVVLDPCRTERSTTSLIPQA